MACERACVWEMRKCLQQTTKTNVTKDSRVPWPYNMVEKIRLALLNGLMCIINVAGNSFKWYDMAFTREVIKAQKISKNCYLCLPILKHMIIKVLTSYTPN